MLKPRSNRRTWGHALTRRRVRNPDLLTAISLLQTGTYSRLPTSLTEPFDTKPPLTNADVTRSLHRLNGFIRYRLRCEDYVPPELRLLEVKDGRAYFAGGAPRARSGGRSGQAGIKRRRLSNVAEDRGGPGPGADVMHGPDSGAEAEQTEDGPSSSIQAAEGGPQWKAEVTWVNFDDYAQAPRWWLTGVEWWWRERPLRSPSAAGAAAAPNESASHEDDAAEKDGRKAQLQARKRLRGVERQRVLDYANQVVLALRPVEEDAKDTAPGVGSREVARRAVEGSVSGTPVPAAASGAGASRDGGVRTPASSAGTTAVDGKDSGRSVGPAREKVDAPLCGCTTLSVRWPIPFQPLNSIRIGRRGPGGEERGGQGVSI